MTALERQMAADAIGLSKEHADRADAAEARWTALRDQITRDIANEQELGDGYSDMGTEDSANHHWGRAETLREVLATMDRMEARAVTAVDRRPMSQLRSICAHCKQRRFMPRYTAPYCTPSCKRDAEREAAARAAAREED
jgi:hypothetical protein